MDSYLTLLYFEKFKITERERQLRSNTNWKDDECGRMDNVRNDQSISEAMKQSEMINNLIESYLKKIISEN